MKKKRGIQSFLVLLMAIICMVVPFSVEAATQTQDGLTVSLTTDKENYAQDEDIQVILSVTNEGNDRSPDCSLCTLTSTPFYPIPFLFTHSFFHIFIVCVAEDFKYCHKNNLQV